MNLEFRLIAAATSLIVATAPAMAHRQWLLPSATIFSDTNQWVSVDAAISNDLFYADHNPMRLDSVKVWQPDGQESRIQNGSTGRYRSTFDVKLDKAGTWKIGTSQAIMMGSFKVNGQEWRLDGRRALMQGQRPPQGQGGQGTGANAPGTGPQARPSVATVAEIPAGATDVKLTEITSRNEIFVTAGAPTSTVFQLTKKGLEMEPITHPDELVSNEPARFRFFADGKPAANLKVTLVPGGKRYRDSEGLIEVTTGTDGVAEIKWPMAGMYWLNATITDNKPSDPKASERRLSYTSTLEVLAP